MLSQHRLADPTPEATEASEKEMTQQNHIVDWEEAKFVDRESDWRTRGIKEAIWTRKTIDSMNRDDGRYRLLHIYDDLLKGHPWRGRGRGAHTRVICLRRMTTVLPSSSSHLIAVEMSREEKGKLTVK